MRTSGRAGTLAIMLAMGTGLGALVAHAPLARAGEEQLADPYAQVALPAPLPAPLAAPLPPLPPPPPPAYAPPPAYGYQPPSVGPVRVAPVPAWQNGYYLYAPRTARPVYYAPPPRPQLAGCCTQPCAGCCTPGAPGCLTRPARPPERIRRFSLGLHGTALGINQTIGREDVILGGPGIQLRIRSKGRFGLELKQDFLYGRYLDGELERTSYPFTFALMLYVFQNHDERHFNLYGLAGLGAMLDSVKLRDQNGERQTQSFLEGLGFVGLGAELRFRWFAIELDGRLVGLIRNGQGNPAAYYAGVEGGPVPERSWGWQANAFLSFWF